MSQLAACNGKAKTTVGNADKAGVDDKDVDSLRDLVASNGKLIRSKRAGLSISESERLSTKADKATKRTRTLAGKVDRLVKAKPLTDARRKCRDALDKAVKASTDAKPSDDATRAAKATLDKLIGQARKLDAKTTVDTWNDMASKLDKARGNLSQALDVKAKATRKPNGRPKRRRKPNSKPRNSNSRRCPRRRRSTAALPAQAPPAYRKATAEEPRTTTMAEHPTATPADGTCHRKPTTTVCRATTQASDKRERSTTMGKNKHRQASTPESKKQAAIWCAIAIIAITVMVLAANPWKQQTSATSTPQSSQSTQTRSHKQNKKKKTTKPSGTLQQQAQSMFTGDAEQIADDVRDLLNAPENSNVDTLGNLLYRHNCQDLAEATDLYDAIGQQKDIDTIRSLAREWYPQAMQAGIEARRDDLSSGLDNTAREVATIKQDNLSGTQGCGDLKAAYETARQLVDSKSDDYDALTKAQQNLTTAMSGCATNLDPTDREKVFGQPQGTLKEDKE